MPGVLTSSTPRAVLTCTTWTEQPVSRASRSARSIALSSAATGREATKARQSVPCGAVRLAGSSAWTATGRSSAAARSMPAASVSSSAAGKSSIPLSHMNALNPTTPRSASSSSRSRLPGTMAPHSAKSTTADARAAATLASNAAPSIVGGWALSGISMQAVAPPAASARVPVDQPSQPVRPGSLKCTCASITPGRMWSQRASISSRAGPEANAAIAPSWIATSRPAAWITRSYGTQEPLESVDGDGDVGRLDRLGGVVADAALTADEQHRGGADRRHHRGVVAGAARQARGDAPGRAQCLVHGDAGEVADVGPIELHAAARGDLLCLVAQLPHRRSPHAVVGVADVERRHGAAGDDVAPAGLGPDAAHGADPLDGEDPLGGGDECVVA